jgi:hypothetical protein
LIATMPELQLIIKMVKRLGAVADRRRRAERVSENRDSGLSD